MAQQYVQLVASGTVAADGTCTVTLQPQAAGTYSIVLIAVSVSVASARSSVAKLYREQVAAQNYLQGTNSGDGDTDTTANLRLSTGQNLVCQWTGAAAGAIAYLRCEGAYTP